MRDLLSIAVCIIGILLAFYVGGYLMFIGGIIQLVQSITPVIIPVGIGFGIGKIFFAGLVGWLIAFCTLLVAKIINS
jgi:hypothetical protein